ncbi:RagB/SusD family nutrient uptake outer membrane protein [Alistipes sp. OttesenSCG-928-B03]|nr:RagB/SusD family nutrient uptake outer membrane protein [Alistipes sp. OttesenSCG-928-B03]
MKSKILILCFTTLFFASCSGFLEEKSQSEVIPKTAGDFGELLLGSGYPYDEPANFTYFMDDDVELLITATEMIGTEAAITNQPIYTWQPHMAEVNGKGEAINENPGSTPYYAYYERIKGCNAVLDHIDSAIGTQEERDRVKAEALAMRAFHYFQLVNIYGEPYSHNKNALGVPLKLVSELNEDQLPRNTVEEVYAQIVTDMKEALRLMESLPILRRSYRIDQPAIHILLSRVYLHMEEWSDCVAQATKAIEKGGDLHDMTESNPYGYTYQSMSEIEWTFGSAPAAVASAYTVSPGLLEIFDVTNDLRYAMGLWFPWNWPSTNGGTYKYEGGEFAQNLRIGEAYLNRAEANAKLGNLGAALSDLNDLRVKRIANYVDEVISDQTGLIEAIRLERRKEFYFEGFRWFDLRRYGMPRITHRYLAGNGETIQTYVLAEKDPMYTIPLPQSVLLRNSNLKQNASATGSVRTPEL